MSNSAVSSPSNSEAADESAMSRLFDRWQGGDPGARDQLIRRMLPNLREKVASWLHRENPDRTVEVTVMVADAAGSLLQTSAAPSNGRGQLMCLAVECMRRTLVEAARSYGTGQPEKGEDIPKLEVAMGFTPEKSGELIQVDEALDELANFDAAGAQAVSLRYFGGLSNAEMASAMDLSEAKAMMVWVEARAWLYMQFQPDFMPED